MRASRLQTAVLVLLVTMLSVTFAVQFGGPQAQGCTSGGSPAALRVAGDQITEGDFRAVYALAGFDRASADQQRALGLRQVVIDGLIERSLLAAEARELGFEATEDDVMTTLAEEGYVRLSLGPDAPPGASSGRISLRFRDEEDHFDVEQAKRFIQNGLRRSVGEFAEMQIDEALAEKMRDVIRASVTVSPGEVWGAFALERERAVVRYVRFRPDHYGSALAPTTADLDAYVTAHAEDVQREYEANRHRYTDLEAQVRASHILLRVASDATETDRDAARTRIEALRRRAVRGEDFATLARENSDDSSASAGGDLGYNPHGRMVGPFDEAQFALEVGQISAVVETQFGFHVIKVTGKREGNVPEDEAKREIADRLFRETRAEELARTAATEILTRLRGGLTSEALTAELAAAAREGDTLAPRVEESVSFPRGGNPIQGLDSSALAQAAFERTLEEPFPTEPLRVGREYVIFQLIEHAEATREAFTDAVRDRIRDDLLLEKRAEAVRRHVAVLRERAESEGEITVRANLLGLDDAEEGDEAGQPSDEGEEEGTRPPT